MERGNLSPSFALTLLSRASLPSSAHQAQSSPPFRSVPTDEPPPDNARDAVFAHSAAAALPHRSGKLYLFSPPLFLRRNRIWGRSSVLLVFLALLPLFFTVATHRSSPVTSRPRPRSASGRLAVVASFYLLCTSNLYLALAHILAHFLPPFSSCFHYGTPCSPPVNLACRSR